MLNNVNLNEAKLLDETSITTALGSNYWFYLKIIAIKHSYRLNSAHQNANVYDEKIGILILHLLRGVCITIVDGIISGFYLSVSVVFNGTSAAQYRKDVSAKRG